MKRVRSPVPCLFLLGLAALALAAAAPPQGTPPAGPAEDGVPPPLPPGPAPDLDLVFTAQVVGWLEPCG